MKHLHSGDCTEKRELGRLMIAPEQNLVAKPASVRLEEGSGKARVGFGICANIHNDIMPDGESHLRVFIDVMQRQNVDFIIQLGDFCKPDKKNLSFLKIWEGFQGPRYHVIGNHDTDGGFTHDQVIAFWKAPDKYYSFDKKGYHFIVLNGNENNPLPINSAGFTGHIGREQQEWLKKDLQRTDLPAVLFCHQRLDSAAKGVKNSAKVRLILENANRDAGFKKVRLVFGAHHNLDCQNEINGISYIQINNMSYQWQGDYCVKIHYNIAIDNVYSVNCL